MTDTPIVTVLTAPEGAFCPKCRAVSRALTRAGVAHEERPITESQRKFYAGHEAKALPVVEIHSNRAATLAHRLSLNTALTPRGKTVAYFCDARVDLVPALAEQLGAEEVSTV